MSTKKHDPVSSGSGHGTSSLLDRLLRKLAKPPSPMAPPGKRSGEGASTVEPYLKEERTTRPGSLE
jgi:hypothetical protein